MLIRVYFDLDVSHQMRENEKLKCNPENCKPASKQVENTHTKTAPQASTTYLLHGAESFWRS
jgi:hypothetical protein